MLNLILLFIIIHIYSIFFSIVLNKKIEYTYILSIMSIVFILYIFGLFNLLRFGVYFIEIIGLFILAYDMFYLTKNKNFFKTNIITKGIFFCVISFLLLIFIHDGRMLSAWDEFSHWGDVVKAMFTIDNFSTSPSSMSTFQSYPPAMNLFQYFCLKIGNNFNESHLFISYHLVGICLFLPFICKAKNLINSIISFVIVLVFPMIIFTNYYTTIYIDGILGLYFGYIILSIIYNKNYDIYFYINILLSIFMLVLLKDVGLFLALIAVITIFIDLIFIKKKIVFTKNFFTKNRKYFLLIVAVVIMISFAKLSWSLNIKFNNAQVAFDTKITFNSLIDLIMLKNLGYKGDVVKNFLNALHKQNIINIFVSFDTIRLSIVFMLMFIFAIKGNKNNYKYGYSIFGGLIIYVIGLLIIYCFKFSEYEAVRLASFERYLSIYFVGILAIIMVILIKKQRCLFVILLILSLFVNYDNVLYIKKSASDSMNMRDPYEKALSYIKENVNSDDKIYVLSQNTNGFDYWILRYSLRPNVINQSFWSIGSKYNEEDIWTLQVTDQEWYHMLINGAYDYVYIYKCDDKFIENFLNLFEDKNDIKNNSLFKINETLKKLVYVE